MNLLDEISAIVNPAGLRPRWKVRTLLLPDAHFDLALIPLSDESKDPEEISLALERLRQSQLATGAKTTRRHAVHVRLDVKTVERRGAQLEAGEFPAKSDPQSAKSFVIHFCDPNATKALHVGHLRNIALGNAIASALSYAGANVERRSVISDIGRNMADTVAAVWPVRDTIVATLTTNSQKTDHLVGRYYTRQVSTHVNDPPPLSTVDIPLAQELVVRHDLADELLSDMLQSTGEVIPLWHAVRDGVIAAQTATLNSLGVRFDDLMLESTFIDRACTIAREGVTSSLFVAEPDGAITYKTGRSDFASLPLVRSDGVPTQHMRTIAYWVLAHSECGDRHMIRVCGEEWRPHTLSTQRLLPALLHRQPGPYRPATIVFHKMVAVGDDVVKSSTGGGVLIDDWLAQIESQVSPALGAVNGGEASRVQLCPQDVAADVALGFFLTRPPSATINVQPDQVPPKRDSLGWLLAFARARACLPITRGYCPANDLDYRFAVLQAEAMPHHLELIAADYDVTPLARFLSRLARWYLQRRRNARVGKVVSLILDHGRAALGLAGQT